LEKLDSVQFYRRKVALPKMSGYSSEVQVNQLFLVDEYSKELVKVTPANLDRLSGITTESGYFEGLGNGCRHFLLTRLFQARTPQESIDLVSGHRHVGREAELSSSTLNYVERAEVLRNVIESEVAQRLGLRIPFCNG